MHSTRRLAALFVALGLAATGSLLAVTPVVADTGTITYNCEIPTYNVDQDIDISMSTNAPSTMAVGETFNPTLTLTVLIPADVIGFAKLFGFKYASADGTLGVGINGTSKTLTAKYPKTKIPDSGDFPVVIKIPLPQLKPTTTGTFKYTPGPVNAQLSVYQSETGKPTSIQADCAPTGEAPVIDTVTVGNAKPASKVAIDADSTTYGKAGKAVVTVSNAAGKAVAGTVTLSGAGPMQTADVKNGKATFPLSRLLHAKTYRMKATYSGSSVLARSETTITFKVKKGKVARIGFALGSKPTTRKSGAATVAVRAPAGLTTPTGTVQLVLKKGRTVKTVTVSLTNGRKAATLPRLSKGTWKVDVRYRGSSFYKSGSKAYSFKVTK